MSRCRGWFFTAWAIEQDPLTEEHRWSNEKFDASTLVFLVYQVEKCPDTGALHAQGVCWFANPRYMKGVKEFFDDDTMHLEPCKSQSNAVGYCMKEDTRVSGPYTYGNVPAVVGRGHRTDLVDGFQLAMEGRVDEVDPSTLMRYGRGVEKAAQRGNKARYSKGLRDPVEVYVYWGPPGVGKSEFVARQWPEAYWKNCEHKWWDGYEEEEVVILDEYDCQFKFRDLLRIFDNKPYQIEVKGGSMWAAWRVVVITCNMNPRSWYPGEDKAPLWRRVTRCTEVRGNTKCLCTVPSLEDGVWSHVPVIEKYTTISGDICTRAAIYDWPPDMAQYEDDIPDYGDELEEL